MRHAHVHLEAHAVRARARLAAHLLAAVAFAAATGGSPRGSGARTRRSAARWRRRGRRRRRPPRPPRSPAAPRRATARRPRSSARRRRRRRATPSEVRVIRAAYAAMPSRRRRASSAAWCGLASFEMPYAAPHGILSAPKLTSAGGGSGSSGFGAKRWPCSDVTITTRAPSRDRAPRASGGFTGPRGRNGRGGLFRMSARCRRPSGPP